MSGGEDSAIVAQAAHPDAPADNTRIMARLSADFMLRGLSIVTEVYGGDLMRGIIVVALVAANTSHLNSRRSAADPGFEHMDDLPPDSARRPISVLALAKSLGLPFENTRRQVNALIAEGICERVKGGVIVPSRVIAGPGHSQMLLTNAANLRRFLRELARAGITNG